MEVQIEGHDGTQQTESNVWLFFVQPKFKKKEESPKGEKREELKSGSPTTPDAGG